MTLVTAVVSGVFVLCIIYLYVDCAHPIRYRSTTLETCPEGAIVTVLPGGRLGSLIWEYASAWALSKYLPGNRTFYSRKYITNRLNNVFETIDTPVVEGIPKDCSCCASVNFSAFTDHYTNFVDFDNVILSRYSMLVEHVVKQMDHLRKHLVYRKVYLDHAHDTIKRVEEIYLWNNPTFEDNLTYVGVHIRRTDYPAFLKLYNLPTVRVDFYKLCIEYFRNRTDLGRSVFLIVTDDPYWVYDNIIPVENNEYDDLHLVSRGNITTPAFDLALLSMCNHSIIDYGSCGYWGAVYAGGVTLVSNVSYKYAKDILKNYDNWHFVDVNSDGSLTLNTE